MQVGDADAVRPHLDDLPLVEGHHGAGLLQDRGDIRGEEVLAVAEPHDQRRGDLDADDHVRLVQPDHDERERPVERADGGADPVGEQNLPAPR